MPDRRSVLAGLLATGLCPRAGWAEAGHPRYLSAGRQSDGAYVLCGLAQDGTVTFQRPLPGRGHAAAAHPTRPLAVAFARRPGTFAVVLDCATGATQATLTAPKGRHFYGHGTFSADGETLFTTENDYDAARGIIGMWDVQGGFRRIAEMPSGGVGPHDIKLLSGDGRLVVANGGIETHPETGRAKLNVPTMRPNLSFLSPAGRLETQIELGRDLHKNSIRHLAVNAGGDVAFAMQWQGDTAVHPPLLGLASATGQLKKLTDIAPGQQAQMRGYAGSVAFGQGGAQIAITSPRGGMGQIFDAETLDLVSEFNLPDTCGVAGADTGFIVTSGTGQVGLLENRTLVYQVSAPLHWDNHLVEIPARPLRSGI